MTVLYPNLCYNELCHKGTALYLVLMEWLIVYLSVCIGKMWLSFELFGF